MRLSLATREILGRLVRIVVKGFRSPTKSQHQELPGY